MALLSESAWQSKIYSNGWTEGGGEPSPVVEPATGNRLGEVGTATAEDVARAARVAAEAQVAWAATPYTERAAVLRKAGDLWYQHVEEVRDWLVRESGKIPPAADFEVHVVA